MAHLQQLVSVGQISITLKPANPDLQQMNCEFTEIQVHNKPTTTGTTGEDMETNENNRFQDEFTFPEKGSVKAKVTTPRSSFSHILKRHTMRDDPTKLKTKAKEDSPHGTPTTPQPSPHREMEEEPMKEKTRQVEMKDRSNKQHVGKIDQSNFQQVPPKEDFCPFNQTLSKTMDPTKVVAINPSLSPVPTLSNTSSSNNLTCDITPDIFHIAVDEELSIYICEIAPDLTLASYPGPFIPRYALTDLKALGRGGYAKVLKGTLDGKPVAIKRLLRNVNHPHFDHRHFMKSVLELQQEVCIHSAIKHENCTKLLGVCLPEMAMIMELAPRGDLSTLCYDLTKYLPWHFIRRVAVDIARGLQHLHVDFEPPIVHLDMKSPNVLIMSYDHTAPVVAKITDFGTARPLVSLFNQCYVDNPLWQAPEIFKNQFYDEKVDIYSYGVILWEMFSREKPWQELDFLSDVESVVKEGQRLVIPKTCPKPLTDFIAQCWDADPDARPTWGYTLHFIDIKLHNKSNEIEEEFKTRSKCYLLKKLVQERERKRSLKVKQGRASSSPVPPVPPPLVSNNPVDGSHLPVL
eukprot:TRINITY_DN9896_c0_g1_i4.p1 TRINITY_DN9896_c0_g1~~TRINITY_DN9896_c0_g1_i4.p1  ORF type:complete len:673 (+),score=174.43 TRINITY_DN9896_c0_g1_i4:295-2019(+)